MKNIRQSHINPSAWSIFKNTGTHKNIDSFIEEIIFAFSNQFIGSTTLLIESQGYKVQVISHQESFLSKQSRYAIIIEREKDIDTLEEEGNCSQINQA